MGLNPSDVWVGGYVDYEWNHLPLILEAYKIDPRDLCILEFGCNIAASATVLAHLGAKVCAIDVSPALLPLARLNAERYGFPDIDFFCVSDTRTLPFMDGQFDLVICNSVLEYVETEHTASVQREIDRIVKVGGKIFLQGTSNRLWPREVHSRRWFVNYVPRAADRFLGKPLQRGIWPWTARHGFGPHYKNLDAADGGTAFLESRFRMGGPSKAIRALVWLASKLRVGPGMLAQNISCILEKQTSNAG